MTNLNSLTISRLAEILNALSEENLEKIRELSENILM